MARIYGIKKGLAEYHVDGNLAKEIIGSGNLVEIIERMERLLDPEITHQILDTCACGAGLNRLKKIEGVASDSLQAKIDRIPQLEDFHSAWDVRINQDGTLTVTWRTEENGRFTCGCPAVVETGTTVGGLPQTGRSMPLTYCFCCAGLGRRHLQRLLDVELKTKEIVSSPIHSKGEAPCVFVLEVVG